MKRALTIALLAAAALTGHVGPEALAEQAQPAAAREVDSQRLSGELRRILADADMGGATVGLIFMDLETGEVILEQQADTLLNPASNAKIVTAAAALAILGPEYRFETALYGDQDGTAVDGPLYLRGRGDPTLEISDIWGLAAELRRRGVRVIRGDIVVDATYFDDTTEPPAFDQQPNERSYFRAAGGRGQRQRQRRHGARAPQLTRPGRPAIVVAEPGRLAGARPTTRVTVEEGAPSRSASRPGPTDDGGTEARVWGSPPGRSPRRAPALEDRQPVALRRRLRCPQALESLDIRRPREQIREGEMEPAGTRLLALPPLGAAVGAALASWERTATTSSPRRCCITLGTRRTTAAAPGSESRQRCRSGAIWRRSASRPTAYQLVNGSGLFDANRYTPRQLATVLRAMWQ